MGSPVVLTNHSMMHELNTPQIEFPSAVLGCWKACGRRVCAVQRYKQGRGLKGRLCWGALGQLYIVLGRTEGLSAEFALMV